MRLKLEFYTSNCNFAVSCWQGQYSSRTGAEIVMLAVKHALEVRNLLEMLVEMRNFVLVMLNLAAVDLNLASDGEISV